MPAELPWDEAGFKALYETVRAELIDTVFTVTAVVERILSSTRRIEKAAQVGTASLALISALNDVKSQLEQLVYPGFVAATGYAQLSQLPRYLAAIEKRLEKLEAGVPPATVATAPDIGLEADFVGRGDHCLDPGRRRFGRDQHSVGEEVWLSPSACRCPFRRARAHHRRSRRMLRQEQQPVPPALRLRLCIA